MCDETDLRSLRGAAFPFPFWEYCKISKPGSDVYTWAIDSPHGRFALRQARQGGLGLMDPPRLHLCFFCRQFSHA